MQENEQRSLLSLEVRETVADECVLSAAQGGFGMRPNHRNRTLVMAKNFRCSDVASTINCFRLIVFSPETELVGVSLSGIALSTEEVYKLLYSEIKNMFDLDEALNECLLEAR